jgi:uncharacterized protein (UPF0261 family)
MKGKVLMIGVRDAKGKELNLLKKELEEKGIDVELINYTKGKVLIVGALDTKGQEFKFLKEELEERDIEVLLMDVGVLGSPFIKADITRYEVALAGGTRLDELIANADRGKAMEVMGKGAAALSKRLYSEGIISGIIGMGGTAGTGLASSAMKVVPIGVPKLIISTVASGDTRIYVGEKDITMMYSVTDLLGLNTISKMIISNAVAAMSGMVKNREIIKESEEKPLVLSTMMGVTTDCVSEAKDILKEKGFDLVAFHAIGSGGKAMESIIQENDILVKGVLDITITEVMNTIVGGICSSGPDRLETAGKIGVPQVVVCGAIDFVNFFPDSIPEKFKGRKFHLHNPQTVLMRTDKEENIKAGQIIAQKLNKSKSSVAFFIPLKGFSAMDIEGNDFYDLEADNAFIKSLEENLSSSIDLFKCNNHINDKEFANLLVNHLLKMISTPKTI